MLLVFVLVFVHSVLVFVWHWVAFAASESAPVQFSGAEPMHQFSFARRPVPPLQQHDDVGAATPATGMSTATADGTSSTTATSANTATSARTATSANGESSNSRGEVSAPPASQLPEHQARERRSHFPQREGGGLLGSVSPTTPANGQPVPEVDDQHVARIESYTPSNRNNGLVLFATNTTPLRVQSRAVMHVAASDPSAAGEPPFSRFTIAIVLANHPTRP